MGASNDFLSVIF